MYQKQQRTNNTVSWIVINIRLCIGSCWGGFIWGNAAFFQGKQYPGINLATAG